MFVPFITPSKRRLFPRKGGGGGGRVPKGGTSGSSAGGSSSSGGRMHSTPISESGTSRSATSYGSGGGRITSIPAGRPFAGRSQGGATRNQIFGSRVYGSGYPGITGLGVAGRNFPFYFWPVVWGGVAGGSTATYLHNNEYGSPENSSRPGGVQETAAFQSNATNTIFRIVSDNSTVAALIDSIDANCSSNLASSSSTSPSPYNASAPDSPKPEQAVEYYRASSVVLTLDGYNNTDALTGDANITNTPLPAGIDTTLLDCLNQTIGLSAPLIDSARQWSMPGMGMVGMVSVFWFFTLIITSMY